MPGAGSGWPGMSDAAAAAADERYWAYREQVARIPRNFGYVAADPLTGKPVPFDGYRPGGDGQPGTLLQAIDPRWAAGLVPGELHDAGRAVAAAWMLDLAERQVRAAPGRGIEWYAPSAATAAAVGQLLSENGLAGQVMVVHGGVAAAGEPRWVSVAVYWGDRAESADRCARRVLAMLGALGGAGLPGKPGWLAAVAGRAHPVPLVTDEHTVTQLLLAGGQYSNETSELVPELGYRLHAAAAAGAAAALSVRCGISAGQPGLPNAVVLTLPAAEQAGAAWAGRSAAVLRALAGAWEPDSEYVTPGLAGTTGASGTSGAAGAAGASGMPGTAGTSASPGTPGTAAPTVWTSGTAVRPPGGGGRGGPGRYRPVPVERSWRDEQYRQQIAGPDGGHMVNGIRYDGWDPEANLLLGAVPPGTALVAAAGYPHARLAMRHELLLRARREAWAAPGCRVEWHVAEPAAVHPARRLLAQAGLSDRFLVRHTPPRDRPPVTRDAPGAGRPWLIAQWEDRADDVGQCADRLRAMLSLLEWLFPPASAGWEAAASPAVGTVPVVARPAAARQLLLMGQSFRDDPGDVITELGFLLTGRRSHDDEHLGFQLSCGVHAADPELRNVAVLDLPASFAAGGEGGKRAEAVLGAVTRAWEPDRAWIADADAGAGPGAVRAM